MWEWVQRLSILETLNTLDRASTVEDILNNKLNRITYPVAVCQPLYVVTLVLAQWAQEWSSDSERDGAYT